MNYRPILSADVEDWLQSTWNREAPIGEVARKNTLALLDRLDRLDVRITMFILGKFAETFPDVVRKIMDAGHEIAAHGHGHQEIFTQTREQFRETFHELQIHRTPVYQRQHGILLCLCFCQGARPLAGTGVPDDQ